MSHDVKWNRNTEIISVLFQNHFISHVPTSKIISKLFQRR